jgi:hypothetical protein
VTTAAGRRGCSPRATALAVALGLVTAGLLYVALVGNRRLAYLTRDPQSTTFERWFLGFFSNIGNALWWAATGAAVLAGLTLLSLAAGDRRGNRSSPRTEPAHFLLAIGAVTAMFAVDDMFGVHDAWGAEENIPKMMFFWFYGLVALAVLWRFRREVARTWLTPLVLAGALYAVSSVVDWLSGSSRSDLRYLGEDGVKLLAIVCWAAWVGHSAFTRLRAGAVGEARTLPYD